MELKQYLTRIGYRGPVEPTLAVLTAIHRAHLLAIPYENLDIHLGRPLTLDRAAIFRKLVLERRGGWCFEMNGLLAAALEAIGFSVRLLSGTVGRETGGDANEGNHLVLLVELDRPYLADVGFGDGFLEPLPLEPGRFRRGFLEVGLERHGDRWIFRNHPWGGAPSFDFTLEPRRSSDFERQCHELQTSPRSGFVRSTVCQRFLPDGLVTLRSASYRRVTARGVDDRVLDSAEEFERVVREEFRLNLPELRALWPRVWARHLEWMASQVGPTAQPEMRGQS